MKIVILTYNFPPQRSAGANRLAGLGRAFQEAGVTTRVVAARFAEDGPLPSDAADLSRFTEWVDCPSVRRGSFLVRFLDEWRIAKRVFARARGSEADFVVVTTPVLSFLLRAPFAFSGRKLVIDLRDLTWEYRISESFLVRALQKGLAMWARWALSRARLVACSTVAEKRYVERWAPQVQTIHVANGIEQDVMKELAASGGAPVIALARPAVVYAGSLGKAQGVAVLAEAAESLPAFDFVVIGDGVEAAELQRARRERHLENLHLLGALPRSEVLQRYRNASVLFVRLRPGFESAVPSKIYEYLAVGKPVVYMGAATDAAWEVLASFAGTARADDDDVPGLVRALREATACSPAEAVENAVRLAGYTREAQAKKLIKRLGDLFAPPASAAPVASA